MIGEQKSVKRPGRQPMSRKTGYTGSETRHQRGRLAPQIRSRGDGLHYLVDMVPLFIPLCVVAYLRLVEFATGTVQFLVNEKVPVAYAQVMGGWHHTLGTVSFIR